MFEYFYPLLLILFATGLLTLGTILVLMFWNRQEKKNLKTGISEDHKIVVTLRLQAYERIILFLERISPNNLIVRVNHPEMNSIQLQSALIRTVREEFEYNLSQQLYISPKAWELVKNAKEEVILLVNKAGGSLPESASGSELVRIILDLFVENERFAVNVALEKVKEEASRVFESNM